MRNLHGFVLCDISMDASVVFEMFLGELKKSYPDLPYDYEIDNTAKEFESFYPSALQILKKETAFFDVERKAFGINLSELEHTEDMWKHITLSTVASVFHGDIKTKFGTLLSAAKSVWTGSGAENDEVSRILNDESSEGHLESLYKFIMDTRIAKIVMEIIEKVDVSSIDIGNIENPAELMEMLKNPEHPVLKKFIAKVQALMREKLMSGSYNQSQMMAEIEGIKAKVESLFGNVLNEALGGAARGDVTSAALMSNSTEARRQRMLARLQRKQREKTQR